MFNKNRLFNPNNYPNQYYYNQPNNMMEYPNFNQYDFNYVMNMIYSDYFGAVPNDTDVYYKMAVKFLSDKDASDGKAFRYYYKLSK